MYPDVRDGFKIQKKEMMAANTNESGSFGKTVFDALSGKSKKSGNVQEAAPDAEDETAIEDQAEQTEEPVTEETQ